MSTGDLNAKIIEMFKTCYRENRDNIRKHGDVVCWTLEAVQGNLESAGHKISLYDVHETLDMLVIWKALIRLNYYPYGTLLHPCYMPSLSLAREFDMSFYRNLLSELSSAETPHQKGKALESTVEDLIYLFEGLSVLAKNLRTGVEEIDITVRNDSDRPFFVQFGDPFLVECKNWSKPVGKKEVVVFIDMLRSKNVPFGILVALEGITGNERSGAWRKILEAKRDGIAVIVLDRNDLEEMTEVTQPIKVLRRKYDEMLKY